MCKDKDCSQSCLEGRDLPPPGQGAEGREQPSSLVSREQQDGIVTLAGREKGCSGIPAPPALAVCVTHRFVNTHFWHGSLSFD